MEHNHKRIAIDQILSKHNVIMCPDCEQAKQRADDQKADAEFMQTEQARAVAECILRVQSLFDRMLTGEPIMAELLVAHSDLGHALKRAEAAGCWQPGAMH